MQRIKDNHDRRLSLLLVSFAAYLPTCASNMYLKILLLFAHSHACRVAFLNEPLIFCPSLRQNNAPGVVKII